MNTKTIVAIMAIFVVLLGAGYAVARPANYGFWSNMMGGYAPGNAGNGYGNGMGSGMMGGCGNMMGYGYPGNDTGANASPITIDQAKDSVEQYLSSTGNNDLKLTEVMEFSNNFYAEVAEKSTGIHAFELIVDKYTGRITPEMGPNMMWNTKYGHMKWVDTSKAPSVTKEQALKDAQEYLDKALPGTKVSDEADAFYGYYTIHVMKDNTVYGMLSVNSYTGAVWYHNWHGEFIKLLEVE